MTVTTCVVCGGSSDWGRWCSVACHRADEPEAYVLDRDDDFDADPDDAFAAWLDQENDPGPVEAS